MTYFNDSRREWELAELCNTCGHRNGLHSMFNKCPSVNQNGTIKRAAFEDTQFQGTLKYDTESLPI